MQTQRNRLQIIPLLLLVVLLAATLTTHAQTFRGGINGTVIDATGAAIADASVIADRTDTGVTTTGVSTSSGAFLFQDLPLGDYTVTVTAAGFQTVRSTHRSSLPALSTRFPIKLAATPPRDNHRGQRRRALRSTPPPPPRPPSLTQRPSPTCRSTAATSPR